MTQQTLEQMKIVHYGHPALRQKATRVGRVTDDVRQLVARMVALMREAGGLGLAANQVGIPRQIAVVEHDGRLISLIDPEIVEARGEEIADEGCLSLPRLYGQVARPTQVVVRARDLSGRRIKVRGENLLARALCHEIDHLNGRLFIDCVDEKTLYWLVSKDEQGECVTEGTTLDAALQAFLAAYRSQEG